MAACPSHPGQSAFQRRGESPIGPHLFGVNVDDLSRVRVPFDEIRDSRVGFHHTQQNLRRAWALQGELRSDLFQRGVAVQLILVIHQEQGNTEESAIELVEHLPLLGLGEYLFIEIGHEQALA